MLTLETIKKAIDKIELDYDATVIYKLRLQVEDCLNFLSYYDDLKETLFSEDFGLNSDQINDIRDIQFMMLDFFGIEEEN